MSDGLSDKNLELNSCCGTPEHQECLILATKIGEQNPYKEPQSAVHKMEKVSIADWRLLCGQLQSDLHNVEVKIVEHKTRAEGLFKSVVNILGSRDNTTISNQITPFRRDRESYISLIDEAIKEIYAARVAAWELETWQFVSLGESVKSNSQSEPEAVKQITEPETAETVKTSVKTYRNAEYGFTIEYPNDWIGITPDVNLPEIALLVGPRDATIQLSVIVEDSDNFDNAFSILMKRLGAQNVKITMDKESSLPDNTPSFEREFNGELIGYRWRVYTVGVIKEHSCILVIVAARGEAGIGKYNRDEFAAIARTIRFD